jgi:hypothetical protein
MTILVIVLLLLLVFGGGGDILVGGSARGPFDLAAILKGVQATRGKIRRNKMVGVAARIAPVSHPHSWQIKGGI